jgi:hypothetical protein
MIPSRKKHGYPVGEDLLQYLRRYNRARRLPLHYRDLTRYMSAIPLMDHEGRDTLWETVYFAETERDEVYRSLTEMYALLKTDGDMRVVEHLTVARVDYCTFGNTRPFRIRIINRLNDNYDHFYVKRADASRVYGLELEELLSPNSVMYLVDGDTMIEEHIVGIPGDDFIKKHLEDTPFDQVRIAKEFIKFNERCFVRLLGDMRSYNYVVAVTPDIEGAQYRIRAIDFDQQSYEGRKTFYLPQYFKENNPLIFMGVRFLTPESVNQYQLEERSLIAARARVMQVRLDALLAVMEQELLSTEAKVRQLAEELARHHAWDAFLGCTTMGAIVRVNLQLLQQKDFRQAIPEGGAIVYGNQ